MGFKKFGILLGIRLVLIMLGLWVAVYMFILPGFHATTFLAVTIVTIQAFDVFRFVSKTNAEISRFLDAAKYADFGQQFKLDGMGAGFAELGETFTVILDRFQAARATQETELRHLKALVEHVPVPLMSVHTNGIITLWNNAARRLFGSTHISKLAHLQSFGKSFCKDIATLKPGTRHLTTLTVDGIDQQIALGATQIIISGASEKLISLQDIQSELDIVQLQAWQDLVRVLTHEIMNSVTPVASLAKTAVDLVDDASKKLGENHAALEELQDVKDAVSTVAKRSDNLMQFVSSYRQLTRLPRPDKSEIQIKDLFDHVTRLATHNWDQKKITLTTKIEPPELNFTADRDMLEQILINLLKNTTQALEDQTNGAVSLTARITRQGRIALELTDNGPGIPADITRQIFVPFFTTKSDGSGVGLALTRQVMIAHGGSVTHTTPKGGGCKFTLTF